MSIEIERSTDGINFTQIGAVPPGVTNYADTSAPTGVINYYEVVANNVDGNSPPSNLAQAAAPPVIGSVGLVSGELVLNGSGGITNGTYYVLTSTNVAAPLTDWSHLQTNQFDGGGSFNFTIPINQNSAQRFYLLKIP